MCSSALDCSHGFLKQTHPVRLAPGPIRRLFRQSRTRLRLRILHQSRTRLQLKILHQSKTLPQLRILHQSRTLLQLRILHQSRTLPQLKILHQSRTLLQLKTLHQSRTLRFLPSRLIKKRIPAPRLRMAPLKLKLTRCPQQSKTSRK